MPNTEEKEFLLGVLPPEYFYQFSQYKIHQHNGIEIKFTLETRMNVCDQKNSYLLKLYFTKSVVGILFLFPCIAVPTPNHGNEIPKLFCWDFISTSLHWNTRHKLKVLSLESLKAINFSFWCKKILVQKNSCLRLLFIR